MYDTIKRLYVSGKLSQSGLIGAVSRGWITQEQVSEITTSKDALILPVQEQF